MSKFSKVLQLFVTFLKIGAFTFGGGYAMIPIIQKEIVEKKKWITDDDILEIIAIAESHRARLQSTQRLSSATVLQASGVLSLQHSGLAFPRLLSFF